MKTGNTIGHFLMAFIILGATHAVAMGAEQVNANGDTVVIKSSDFPFYLQNAERGDSEAQRRVAICYIYGTGTERNAKKGIEWLGKSVNQGNNEAQYDLAVLYRDGIGVAQSDTEALYWFRKSGRNGNPMSHLNLGIIFEEGRGVQQDYRIAIEEYWRAADMGNKAAAYRLACLLRDGKGKGVDNKSAYKWFTAAGEYKDAAIQAEKLKKNLPAGEKVVKKRK